MYCNRRDFQRKITRCLSQLNFVHRTESSSRPVRFLRGLRFAVSPQQAIELGLLPASLGELRRGRDGTAKCQSPVRLRAAPRFGRIPMDQVRPRSSDHNRLMCQKVNCTTRAYRQRTPIAWFGARSSWRQSYVVPPGAAVRRIADFAHRC